MKYFLCALVIVFITLSLTGCGGNMPTSTSQQNNVSQTGQSDSTVQSTTGQNTSAQAAAQTAQQPEEQVKKVEFEVIPTGIVAETYIYRNSMGLFIYNGKYGYFGYDGKVIIEPKYKEGQAFYSDYTMVCKTDGSMCIIDKQGKETPLSTNYSFKSGVLFCNTYKFLDGIAIVDLNTAKLPNGKFGFAAIDTSGKEIFRVTDYGIFMGVVKGCYMFYNLGYATGECNAVIYDKSGNKLSAFTFVTPLPQAFNLTIDNKDGLILAKKKGADGSFLSGVLDTNGNTVLDYTFEALKAPSEGMIAFKKNGKWGFIDYTGKVVVEPSYEEAYTFSNGLCPVKVGGLIGFINKENKMVIQPKYDPKFVNTVDFFKFNNDGIALVSQVPATFIDKTGKEYKFDGAAFDYNIDESILPVYQGKVCKIYRLKK